MSVVGAMGKWDGFVRFFEGPVPEASTRWSNLLTGDRSPVVEVRECVKCGRVVRDWYDSVDGPLCAMCGL